MAEAANSAMDRVRQGLESDDKGDLESAVDELEQELQALRESSAAAEAEASQLQASVATSKDQLLRLTADFDNYRRRTAAQTALTAENSKGDVMKQLLPIIDGFEQARTQVKAETEGEQKINNSYQGLYKQMVELLRNLGVEPVPTVGTPFDPEIHEAIMREASSEHPEGTVLVEFRKGFRLGEKLLRPAMVQVSFRDDDAPASSPDEASDE